MWRCMTHVNHTKKFKKLKLEHFTSSFLIFPEILFKFRLLIDNNLKPQQRYTTNQINKLKNIKNN